MQKIYYFGIPVALVVLAFGYYAISPLFRSVEMNDAVPEAGIEIASAEVVGTPGHPAYGTAKVIEAGGKKYLRYEHFSTLNGPDLLVYLAKDLDATDDFVNLGRLKATDGSVNYEIPAGVNPEDFPYALVWCRAFSVLFNFARLF